VTGAEGLAGYTAGAHPPDYPAYHVVIDCDSGIRTARDNERVNGAGGVAEIALHLCFYGSAGQSSEQWHDPYSKAELVLGAALTREWCGLYGLPVVRVSPTPGARGICGHVDVSAIYASSQGHTDPGPGFPWAEFLAMVANAGPTPEQVAAYLALLEELDVEHGMAVDVILNPADPTSGYTLDRWGGIHQFGKARGAKGTGWWPQQDVARRIVVTDWVKALGYVMDLDGGMHPFGPADKSAALPPALPTAYWPGGKIVAMSEL